MIIIFCAGASELTVSQWSSAFVEKNLGISKTAGDLLGPAVFSVMMGLGRLFYGKFGDNIDLDKVMKASGILCILSFLTISLVPSPVISLIGMALSGLSVAILWPGTFSCASASIRNGGSAMFAILAMCGDIGCASGPAVAGIVSGMFSDDLKKGILAAVIFPVIMLIFMHCNKKTSASKEK